MKKGEKGKKRGNSREGGEGVKENQKLKKRIATLEKIFQELQFHNKIKIDVISRQIQELVQERLLKKSD